MASIDNQAASASKNGAAWQACMALIGETSRQRRGGNNGVERHQRSGHASRWRGLCQ